MNRTHIELQQIRDRLHQLSRGMSESATKLSLVADNQTICFRLIAGPKAYQEAFLAIRDSIIHRFDSMCFHVVLMIERQLAALRSLEKESSTFDERDLLESLARQHQFLFDDIIFNTISLLDYLGNIVGLAFHGAHLNNMNWNGAYRYAKDYARGAKKLGQNRIFGSSTADCLIRHHEEWANKVCEYRNRLIHDKEQKTGGSIAMIWQGDLWHELTITAPKSFVKVFPVSTDKLCDGELQAILGGVLLVEKTASAAIEMMKCLREDMARLDATADAGRTA